MLGVAVLGATVLGEAVLGTAVLHPKPRFLDQALQGKQLD